MGDTVMPVGLQRHMEELMYWQRNKMKERTRLDWQVPVVTFAILALLFVVFFDDIWPVIRGFSKP